MIKTYADKHTQAFAKTGKSKRLPRDVHKRAIMRLDRLDIAKDVSDLRIPPSHNLEKLSGDRADQYSIRINKQWRVCFEFRSGNAYNVQIIDYH